MKASIRQKFLIAVGISAGLLASMNLFAQESNTAIERKYTINSEAAYLLTVESIEELSTKIYNAHQKYPQLSYSHVYDNKGVLMGFTVTGVPQSSIADEISVNLMELEALGNAINTMDYAYLPDSKNTKLTSRVSKKKAMESLNEKKPVTEPNLHASGSSSIDLTTIYE